MKVSVTICVRVEVRLRVGSPDGAADGCLYVDTAAHVHDQIDALARERGREECGGVRVRIGLREWEG